MDSKDFGIFFAEIREKSGYKSQRQLALASNVSNGTIARIEAGTQKPQPETLKILSHFLKNVTYEELLEKSGYLTSDNHLNENNFANHNVDKASLVQFGERIAILRTEKGFSLQKLADELGIEKNALVQYESGELNPNIEDIRKLAEFFDVSTDHLLGKDKLLTKEDISKELQENGISMAFYDGLEGFDQLEPEQQQFILQQVKQSIEMFKKMREH
ncbi:helix-turn-helix protein [Aneurinibacillus soli]|uniref:HTH-type transcriptional regulator ImmR n=1 Tax=Aneurinibacillus soli TaxID=1500254 RepID=A0A0U4WKJ3_9BACL|nr:helix-turn-helix domain-containing protein [Aneurinibacillus soli]PYE62954.1 helix-turn-helix protein [Aneurinibacillus soli]BAU28987.1 HTH-type transcriptional regulator ImmR [Aneurinibacillus soli]